MNKLYSTKTNAKHAAIAALGPHAMEGADYRLVRDNGRPASQTVTPRKERR